MLRIQDTNITSAGALKEDEYTDVLNEEIREERDNNGYCDGVSTLMIS
jgi:hypothetical protein